MAEGNKITLWIISWLDSGKNEPVVEAFYTKAAAYDAYYHWQDEHTYISITEITADLAQNT